MISATKTNKSKASERPMNGGVWVEAEMTPGDDTRRESRASHQRAGCRAKGAKVQVLRYHWLFTVCLLLDELCTSIQRAPGKGFFSLAL